MIKRAALVYEYNIENCKMNKKTESLQDLIDFYSAQKESNQKIETFFIVYLIFLNILLKLPKKNEKVKEYAKKKI